MAFAIAYLLYRLSAHFSIPMLFKAKLGSQLEALLILFRPVLLKFSFALLGSAHL